MGKKIKVLAVLFLFIGCAKAQIYLDSLDKQSKAMVLAFKENDFQTLLKYTHPKIISLMGGVDSALVTLKKGVEIIKERGVSYIEVSTGKYEQIIKLGQVIQCLIPQISEAKVRDEKIKAKSYLIGISYNNGKNWYFINANKEREMQLKKLIPEISKELIIPEFTMTAN
ncbi:hypothetical protein EZ449_07700 [Pedobacter frigidisoli]|uniref:Lipoprotein n=1 Tax=Pedobacter frigidisoli TaxID=2530455 RepID=A0A4R0P1U3_9SPHI|nr:hypothetical protein [Pedobacter frigidisoli]TCD10763.1 hypothetical protein EZ449_07700 [Pedobacter frigidisoli]